MVGLRRGAGRARGDGRHAAQLVRIVITEGMQMTLAGIAIGLMLAGALSRLLVAQLFQIEAIDPLLYATATTLIVGVAGLACSVPVYRAVRINPATVLRGMKPESLKFKV